MIRVNSHQSAAAAKSYYGKGLSREDYYSEGQEVIGRWQGIAAQKLGLEGEVTKEAFERLCDNQHPVTGEQLTPRNDANRIVGFDINFHAPKSLSIVQALTGDQRLIHAFRESVRETMDDIESQTTTRVRKQGAYEDRWVGNLAWAEFVHFTARPVDGEPDPHLHVHAFVPNVCFDEQEQRWKALKLRDARQDMPLHQAAFHARLSQRVSSLGYAVQRTRNGWEIIGIDSDVIDRYSRRTTVIEEEAAKRGLTSDKDKDGLGVLTREGKRKGMSREALHESWAARLSEAKLKSIQELRFKNSTEWVHPSEAVDHAIEKQFARDAVIRKSRLLAEAMRFGVGNMTPEQVWQELTARNLVEKDIDGEILCTTLDVLVEEVGLIASVRSGKGRFRALGGGNHPFSRDYLSSEQKAAVSHILRSQDRVIALRGGAGTGKTTAMQEVVEAIEANGKLVFAFAPSASASRETLREAGFIGAETVAHYLQNQRLQELVRGQVIWIDEAGLLGTRDMWRVLEAAGPDTRIILTGDNRQHAPVARGDPFRVMQEFAGLNPAELNEIRRQKPEDYKGAVHALSKGNLGLAFERLDQIGAIQEIQNDNQRYRQLADDYLKLSSKHHKPLVVSPTHKESRAVTGAIRTRLLEAGKLGKEERSFPRYRNLHWEEASRKENENYRSNLMIQYHQNAEGIRRGERFWISAVRQDGKVMMRGVDGQERELSKNQVDRFQVFEKESISLRQGDLIRITRNGKSQNGRRHSNGNVREIAGFTKEGNIKLTTGAVIDKQDGHFSYGYCQTSHTAQSKSVRDVLVAQSAHSFAASNREQFYVSVSRGQHSIRIYTDDRLALQEAVGNSSARVSALELANFTSHEIEAFMKQELDRNGWRKALERRRLGKEEGQTHRQHLAEDRKGSKLYKPKAMTWSDYVKRRRGLGDSPERNRGRGFPNLSKNPRKPRFKGFTGLKTRGARTKTQEKGNVDQQPTQTPQQPKPDQKPTVNRRDQVMGRMKKGSQQVQSQEPAKQTGETKKKFDSGMLRNTRQKPEAQKTIVNGHKARVKKQEVKPPVSDQKKATKTVQPKPATPKK